MAPNPKVVAAFQAMKCLGIPQQKVKPVLKGLLRRYEMNWAPIEEENYRVLVDAIFEAEDAATEQNKRPGKNANEHLLEEEELEHEPEHPLKRPRLRGHDVNEYPELVESRTECSRVSPRNAMRNKGKESMVAEEGLVPFSPPFSRKRSISERVPHCVRLKEPVSEAGRIPKNKVTDAYKLIEPKDEPYTDDMFMNDLPQYEAPIAVTRIDPLSNNDLPGVENIGSRKSIVETSAEIAEESAPECGETNCEAEAGQEDEPCSNLDVAASAMGAVKLSLSCNSADGRREFRLPSLGAVIKMAEEKCLHSFEITDPKFSVVKVLRHVCESFLELGTDNT